MFIYEPRGRHGGALSWKCDECGKGSWPVRRIMGFPGPEAEAAEAAGLAVFLGCEPIMDSYLFQCPHCGAGCEVDEGLVAEGHWTP